MTKVKIKLILKIMTEWFFMHALVYKKHAEKFRIDSRLILDPRIPQR